jgi:hypothetical protein
MYLSPCRTSYSRRIWIPSKNVCFAAERPKRVAERLSVVLPYIYLCLCLCLYLRDACTVQSNVFSIEHNSEGSIFYLQKCLYRDSVTSTNMLMNAVSCHVMYLVSVGPSSKTLQDFKTLPIFLLTFLTIFVIFQMLYVSRVFIKCVSL